MIVYGELDSMVEHRTQFAFKGKREHIAKVNIPNIAYLSQKEHEEKLIQGIQSANGLKARVGGKKTDGTALTLTTQENSIKMTFDKRFSIPLDFDFFKHLCIHIGSMKI